MPYRVDLQDAREDAIDRLIDLGALDVDVADEGGVAAIMPDSVTAAQVASVLGPISVSPATGRDERSVWILKPRPIRVGRLHIVPADMPREHAALRLLDAAAFGTGLHPTTALCLEALEQAVDIAVPDDVLDVGTGSGVLALAALIHGVPRVTGIDVDEEALRVAAENARINGLRERVHLVRGGPDAVARSWPLVLANVLAAPLIEIAPALVPRVGHRGELVLSGIPTSVERDVDRTYRRLGMQRVRATSRDGWVALTLRASW